MKKKIFIIAVAVCLAVLSIAGSSIAYFTDTEEFTNVFTAGDVAIQLTETKDGQTVYDSEKDQTQQVDFGKLYPGVDVNKVPVIKNIGTEDAYIGAIITITNDDTKNTEANIASLLELPTTTIGADSKNVAINAFIGGLIDTNVADVKYVKTDDTCKIYIIAKGAVTHGNSVALFDTVVMPDSWDNAEMKHCKDLNISVEAYAVQTAGFTGNQPAIDAILAAFATEWADSGFTTNP